MPNSPRLFLLLLSLFFIPPLTHPITSPQPPPPPPTSTFRRSPPRNPAAYVSQCINHTIELSDTINRFLERKLFELSPRELSALRDCSQLAELSVDHLHIAAAELSAAQNNGGLTVGRVETMLSAAVTNQQTCYDGLVGSDVAAALVAPLDNASRLYSVSLGLVSHAWCRRGRDVFGNPDFAAAKMVEAREIVVGGRLIDEGWMKGMKVSEMVTVSPYGGSNITSIGEAIEMAPNNTNIKDGYFVIYAKEGWYEENVVVPKHKKNIVLVGDGINRTVISGNRSVADGWTTFNSATFAVSGERFVAIDVTFKNTAGPAKHQAVALRNNADLSAFYRCSFEGYQDTLYAHSLRQFYRDCHIYGTVDFIFGNAAAVFQNCHLYARKPLPNQKNIFTAQGRTNPNQNTGLSIQNCTIQAAPDLNVTCNGTRSFLGRPWKAYSRTVIMQSYIGDLVDPAGWLEWDGGIGLDTLYYGEFENYGEGADTSMRVQWPGYSLMNVTQAMNFTVYNLTMGDTWLNYTNVPFSQGLV